MALITAAAALVPIGVFATPALAAANDYAVAYAGNNNHLWIYTDTLGTVANHDTGVAIDLFAAPAIVPDEVNGTYDVAFVNPSGQLSFYYTANGEYDNTGIPMYSLNASPSMSEAGYVAFEGGNGDLWYWDGNGGDNGGHDTGYAMDTIESHPSISYDANAIKPGQIAFEGKNRSLWMYDMQTGGATNTGLGMAEWSSPSIGRDLEGDCCYVAFQANTNVLWYYIPGYGGYNTGQKMYYFSAPSYDPSALSGDIAYVDPNRHLGVYDLDNHTNLGTGLGLNDGTSPDIGPMVDSSTGELDSMQAFFVANGSDDLWYFNPDTRADGNLGVAVNPNAPFVSYTTGVESEVGTD